MLLLAEVQRIAHGEVEDQLWRRLACEVQVPLEEVPVIEVQHVG